MYWTTKDCNNVPPLTGEKRQCHLENIKIGQRWVNILLGSIILLIGSAILFFTGRLPPEIYLLILLTMGGIMITSHICGARKRS